MKKCFPSIQGHLLASLRGGRRKQLNYYSMCALLNYGGFHPCACIYKGTLFGKGFDIITQRFSNNRARDERRDHHFAILAEDN